MRFAPAAIIARASLQVRMPSCGFHAGPGSHSGGSFDVSNRRPARTKTGGSLDEVRTGRFYQQASQDLFMAGQ